MSHLGTNYPTTDHRSGVDSDEVFRQAGERSEIFDQVRPPYPNSVMEAILAFNGAYRAHVLEIGCGCGKATATMAEYGVHLTATDPSQPLIEVAKRKLSGSQNVCFLAGKLADIELTDGSFDLVVAAQSIHWVDSRDRWAVPARLLRPGGTMAFMSNFRVASTYDSDTWRELKLDELYKSECPEFSFEYGSLQRMLDEQKASGLFTDEEVSYFRHETTLSRADYLLLQQSLPGVSALSPIAQKMFLSTVESLLENADEVRVPWRTVLVLAQRLQ